MIILQKNLRQQLKHFLIKNLFINSTADLYVYAKGSQNKTKLSKKRIK